MNPTYRYDVQSSDAVIIMDKHNRKLAQLIPFEKNGDVLANAEALVIRLNQPQGDGAVYRVMRMCFGMIDALVDSQTSVEGRDTYVPGLIAAGDGAPLAAVAHYVDGIHLVQLLNRTMA